MRIRISFCLFFIIPVEALSIFILHNFNLSIHNNLDFLYWILMIMASTTLLHFVAILLRVAQSTKCLKEEFVRIAIQIIYCLITAVCLVCTLYTIFFNRRLPKDISPDLIPQYRRITSSLRKICNFVELYAILFTLYYIFSFTYKQMKKKRST